MLLPGRSEAVQPVHSFADLFGGPARLLVARSGELDLFVLDAPWVSTRERAGAAHVEAADGRARRRRDRAAAERK